MAGPYLTAVLELRPTRRKAAVLERVRAAAENVFWDALEKQENRNRAQRIVAIENVRERWTAWREAEAAIGREVGVRAEKAGLPEPVIEGLVRDVTTAIKSYVELRVGKHEAEWPARKHAVDAEHDRALEALASAVSRKDENAARDALGRVARQPGPRGIMIARSRDALLVRKSATGAIAVVLNVLRASDDRARKAAISAGIDATTGDELKAQRSAAKLVIPISCSKWHEQKFLTGKSGGTILRSSLILRRGERWFMCAQFEFPKRQARLTRAALGIDRGVVNPVALAVVDGDGAVKEVSEPLGAEIGTLIRTVEEKRRQEQRRRGRTSRRHAERVEHSLHRLANRVVGAAQAHGAEIIVEKLGELKRTITTARPKGSRRGGWRRVLKRAQLGRLEQMIAYKAALAGLPRPREVIASGTSQTCPACGERDKGNRPAQDRFACVACGFAAHADVVAAVNIARRGVVMRDFKEGDKLAPREQNMAQRLRARGDGGLGLLAGHIPAGGFVADRAAAEPAYDGHVPLTGSAGQNAAQSTQNGRKRVFAERRGAFSDSAGPVKIPRDQRHE